MRIEGVLRQMARHFDLTVIAPAGPAAAPQGIRATFVAPPVRVNARLRSLGALVDPARPYHVSFYSRPEVARAVNAELQRNRYDLIYSHFIYGLEYVDGRIPVVVDQQNVDRDYWQNKADLSRFPLNAFFHWNTRKTIRYEMAGLKRVWAYVSVSEEDRERTRRYASPSVPHFFVAGNGVDTTRFVPGSASSAAGTLTLGYLGSMDLQMNVDAVQRFCTALLPRIRSELRGIDVRLVVIGRRPAASIRRLAARIPGMTLTGTVADVVPWLQRLSLLVSPLRIGAGTKLKVSEALACGIPVVGTSLAFAGVPGVSGEHFVRADDDQEFVSAVCRLARDPSARDVMGRRAREVAVEHLDWDRIGDRLSEDIRRALADQ